jgi:hypothetical protein
MGDMIINFMLMHTNPLLTGEIFEPCISSALLASLMHFLALPTLIDLILTPFHLPLMGDMIINYLLMHTNPLLTGEKFEPCISYALIFCTEERFEPLTSCALFHI